MKIALSLSRGRLIVLTALFSAATNSQIVRAATVEQVEQAHVSVAMQMDTAYREAGSRIDIAGFDLAEAARQGRSVPKVLGDRVAKADRELRAEWLALENTRLGIARRISLLSDTNGGNALTIENLSDGGSGEADWFALRQATVVLGNGQRIEIAPRDFKGGTYRDSYSYQCEPAAMVAVYGRQSTTHTARAAVTVATKPHGAILEISGLDQDKPGRTPIRVSLNGVKVTEGPNEFQKIGWSEKQYAIPDAAWGAVTVQEAPADVLKDIEGWKARILTFAAQGKASADAIDTVTRPIRANLVWKKRNYGTDWWKHTFLRAMCYETDSILGPEYNRPWFPDNKEYIAKAFDAAGVNLIYDYPGGDYGALGVKQYSELARHNDPIGTPVIEVFWPSAQPAANPAKPDPPARLFEDADTAHKLLDGYLSRLIGGGNARETLRGVAVDEPRILKEDRFEDSPVIRAAFKAYLLRRHPMLQKAGVSIDTEAPPVVTVKTKTDLPAWMEWQYFKAEYVSDFYVKFGQKLGAQKRIALPVIQDYLNFEPQSAPYPAYGEKLPMVATDLYNNAGINEAFGMDLLRSVTKGKALLVNGSGYSARNPSRFARTQANAMLRADGVLTWIYTYASKYRYRYFFLKPGMLDDRGRSLLDSWKPEYWDILDKTYRGMAKAEPFLTNTTSTAQIGVLYSMRSVVAASAFGAGESQQVYRNVLYTYNALQDLHRSVEACMIEGLTADKLKRYRVLYLIDAQSLTAAECARLRDWVKTGGTLVVSGRTGLKDEWGRDLPNYALADLMGVHYKAEAKAQSAIAVSGASLTPAAIKYDPQMGYATVDNTGASVLGSWANGDAALLKNKYGQGQTYTITANRPGEYLCDSEPKSGRFKWQQPGFPELFSSIAKLHVRSEPVKIVNAPKDLEVQIRRKGKAWIVQLLDWRDGRTVKDLKLAVSLPGVWKASYAMEGKEAGSVKASKPLSLRSVNVHDMVVLQPG